MVSVFNALPVTGIVVGAAFNTVVTRSTTAATETVNEIIWLLQAGGY